MNWLEKMSNMGVMDMQALKSFLPAQGNAAFLKYVRVGGEYRFSNVEGYGIGHKTLANGEQAEGAGFLQVYPDGFRLDGHSATLGMGPAADDEDRLSQLLGLPVMEDRF